MVQQWLMLAKSFDLLTDNNFKIDLKVLNHVKPTPQLELDS